MTNSKINSKINWNLQQISQWVNGQILSSLQSDFSEVSTDTREPMKDKIFIALKGDNFDAHQFLDQAVKQDAGALIVHQWSEQLDHLKEKVSVIKVKDTLKALQDFAKEHRKTLKTRILSITGSNGKTTTKEFTAQILSQFKKTYFNQGSFNNHWGVPLTLLQITPDTEFAVVEMGMNRSGEITELVRIADPDIVVCTMVGSAHIEFFGTQRKIAEAKQEIYMATRPDCVRIFNQDQDLTFDMMYPVSKDFPASRMLSFSHKNDKADVYFQIESLTMRSMKIHGLIAGISGAAEVPVFGHHNLVNLMAASTLAYACGMPPEKIWQTLSQCRTTWGRNQFVETEIGAEVLFDGYNANPDSMQALLENIPLLKAEGKKIGIFGQMKELGNQSAKSHTDLGLKVAKIGFDEIYFIGENVKDFTMGLKQGEFDKPYYSDEVFTDTLGQTLSKSIKKGDVITIKGSRGALTEKFISYCKPINWKSKN